MQWKICWQKIIKFYFCLSMPATSVQSRKSFKAPIRLRIRAACSPSIDIVSVLSFFCISFYFHSSLSLFSHFLANFFPHARHKRQAKRARKKTTSHKINQFKMNYSFDFQSKFIKILHWFLLSFFFVIFVIWQLKIMEKTNQKLGK